MVGLDPAAGRRAVERGVVEVEHAPVAACPAHSDEARGIHRRPGPSRHPGDPDRGDPPPQTLGEQPLELDQRAEGLLLQPRDPRAARRGLQRHRDGHRLLVVEQKRRELCTGAEPVAAGRSEVDLDRVVEPTQLVDVAAHGPGGDAEPLRELGAAPLGTHLQQGEQAQQTGRGLEHAAQSAGRRTEPVLVSARRPRALRCRRIPSSGYAASKEFSG